MRVLPFSSAIFFGDLHTSRYSSGCAQSRASLRPGRSKGTPTPALVDSSRQACRSRAGQACSIGRSLQSFRWFPFRDSPYWIPASRNTGSGRRTGAIPFRNTLPGPRSGVSSGRIRPERKTLFPESKHELLRRAIFPRSGERSTAYVRAADRSKRVSLRIPADSPLITIQDPAGKRNTCGKCRRYRVQDMD